VVAVGIAVSAARNDPGAKLSSTPLIGHPAPPLAGAAVTGGRASLASYRGRWVIVNFFASWCVPCQTETPEPARFADAHPAPADATVHRCRLPRQRRISPRLHPPGAGSPGRCSATPGSTPPTPSVSPESPSPSWSAPAAGRSQDRGRPSGRPARHPSPRGPGQTRARRRSRGGQHRRTMRQRATFATFGWQRRRPSRRGSDAAPRLARQRDGAGHGAGAHRPSRRLHPVGEAS
jgi:hypothetical protein